MKATLLEQMKRDYIHIKQTKAVTRDQVERQEEVTMFSVVNSIGYTVLRIICLNVKRIYLIQLQIK